MPDSASSRAGPTPDSLRICDRADRAGREDHLAATARRSAFAVLPPAHAGGALAVEHDAFHQALGFQPQVRPAERRLEKAARRRPAPPALLVDVEDARALVVAGVEIGDRLDAGLAGGVAESVEDVPAHARRLDAPFAADRVRVAGAEEMILVPPEERQHVVPAPAGKPELAPVIVVGGLTAHIDHGVDGGGAADHLAAGIVEAAAVEPFLRLGLEHPVRARIADGEEIADRDVEPDPVVHAAGFEQQHAHSGVGGKSIRQHAAGRARADDDVVVFAFDRRCGGHAISTLCSIGVRAALSACPLPRTKQPGKDSGPSPAACTVIQA